MKGPTTISSPDYPVTSPDESVLATTQDGGSDNNSLDYDDEGTEMPFDEWSVDVSMSTFDNRSADPIAALGEPCDELSNVTSPPPASCCGENSDGGASSSDDVFADQPTLQGRMADVTMDTEPDDSFLGAAESAMGVGNVTTSNSWHREKAAAAAAARGGEEALRAAQKQRRRRRRRKLLFLCLVIGAVIVICLTLGIVVGGGGFGSSTQNGNDDDSDSSSASGNGPDDGGAADEQQQGGSGGDEEDGGTLVVDASSLSAGPSSEPNSNIFTAYPPNDDTPTSSSIFSAHPSDTPSSSPSGRPSGEWSETPSARPSFRQHSQQPSTRSSFSPSFLHSSNQQPSATPVRSTMAGSATTTNAPSDATLPPPEYVLVNFTLLPTDDASIRSKRSTRNYGDRSNLVWKSDNSTDDDFLLKFDTSPVQQFVRQFVSASDSGGGDDRKVVKATLWLYCLNDGEAGGTFTSTSDTTWEENTVTWENAPVSDGVEIVTLGPTLAFNWYQIDVTQLLIEGLGSGVADAFSIRASIDSADRGEYSSKENEDGSYGPRLEVVASSPATKMPTRSPSADAMHSTSAPSSSGADLGNTTALDPTEQQLITFYVLGDAPYTLDEKDITFPQQIDGIPTDADFVVHVGDMQRIAENECKPAWYEDVAEMLSACSAPVFITPGDNDYSDCSDDGGIDEAWETWADNFMRFDERHWPSHGFDVDYQDGREENLAFLHQRVLFVMVHLVNDVSASSERREERRKRHADGLAFTREKLSEYDGRFDVVVIISHATPTSDHNDYFRAKEEGIATTVEELGMELGIPFLYIHGSGHSWVEEPFFENLPNFLRIQVPGRDKPPVKVKIDVTSASPIRFDRRLEGETAACCEDGWPAST